MGEAKTTIDVALLIKAAVEFCTETKSIEQVAIEYGPAFIEPVKAYALPFARDMFFKVCAEMKNEGLKELWNKDFGNGVVNASIEIYKAIFDYRHNRIDEIALMKRIGESGAKDVVKEVITKSGIDEKALIEQSNALLNTTAMITAFAAFAEAYKIYMKALEDASIQHEHRIQIEKECRECIEYIKEYRHKLEVSISEYFNEYLDGFEEAFVLIDKSIIDNDSNGYIKGNIELQKIFNYRMQFNNQKEFDDLMSSENSLKL